jgi:hypothetical protein
VQKINGDLHLPTPTVHLIDNSVVGFSMADGRIEHHNLAFHLDRVMIETHGSVGVDQSLDMVADVTLSGKLLADGLLAEAMNSKPLSLHFRGTLAKPELDGSALRAANKEIIHNAAEGLLERVKRDGGLLDRLLKPKGDSQPKQ